jgi:signal transduction histidine kinase
VSPGASPPRHRPWRTIRFRITAVALAAVLATLALSAVVLVRSQRDALVDQVDADLTARAEQLAASVARDGAPSTLLALGDDLVVQVVSPDGTVLAQSADEDEDDDDDGAGRPIVAPGTAPAAALDEDGELDDADPINVVLPDGAPARAVTVTVASPDGPLTVTVARSDLDVEDAVDSLASTLALVVPALALVLATSTWVLVGRTLRPVDQLRRRVAEIGAEDLSTRVPEPGTDDEIDRLARTMNQMLARLEAASERERRFVSDASHELRSPLTRMRAALEVDRAHPATADHTATGDALLRDVEGLGHLVDDLLQLAAGDASAGERRPLDLDDLVREEVLATVARPAVAIDATDLEPVQLLGDRRALARVLRNLLDNAARHATSSVVVSLRSDGGWAHLTVADDGPGIPAADRERVFERFVRLDDARTAGTGGTGLGLAIVRSIVDRHEGTVEAQAGPSGGAVLAVHLPPAPRTTDRVAPSSSRRIDDLPPPTGAS